VTNDGAKVLLVDDTKDDLELYFEALSRQRMDVVTASNGSQALEKALTCVPQAIVLDVALPGMDGIEVCRRLKAVERTRRIPVIFLSALSDTRTRERARHVGAASYLVKPCLPSTLVSEIATVTQNPSM